MPEGLLEKYSKGRKISRSVVEYLRTGKTKEEREVSQAPLVDTKDGFIELYVVSQNTSYVPSMPLSGYTRPTGTQSDSDILFKLILKSPTTIFYLDEVEGKKVHGSVYDRYFAESILQGLGVADTDIKTVMSCFSDEVVPSYFNSAVLTDILSSAGFLGFSYSSPFDKNAFTMWGGLENITVSSYSIDSGSSWVEV